MLVRDDHYLTTAQGAAHLGVSERTVQRWVADGRVAPVIAEPGRPSVYRLADLARAHRETRSRAWHERVERAAAAWREHGTTT